MTFRHQCHGKQYAAFDHMRLLELWFVSLYLNHFSYNFVCLFSDCFLKFFIECDSLFQILLLTVHGFTQLFAKSVFLEVALNLNLKGAINESDRIGL